MHFDHSTLPDNVQPYPGCQFIRCEFRVIVRTGPKAEANGDFDLVSPEWYDRLIEHRWNSDDFGYSIRKVGYGRAGSKKLRMHLDIARANGLVPETAKDECGVRVEVDHRDGNPRNNTVCNLRRTNRSSNAMNVRRQANNTSGHKGVYYKKKTGKWAVQVRANKKVAFTGVFSSLEEAVAAATEARARFHGEFANHG